MPEINDVQIGETIAVEWGNAIRDRTIQRYANAAERAELHPNPTEGDLSYLEDTNSIEVFDGFAWVAGIPNQAVTTAKLADGAVTTPKIAQEAVTFSRIAPGAVGASKIAGAAIAAFERSGNAYQTGVSVPSSVGNLATVTLNIPSSWSSWECVAFAHATADIDGDTPSHIVLRVDIDENAGASFSYHVPTSGPVAAVASWSYSDLTTTGNRTIRLRGYRNGPSVQLLTVFLYARAFRTS